MDRVVDAVAKLGHGVVGQSAEIVVGILVDRLVLVHHLGPLTLTIILVLHPVVKAVDAAIRPKRAGAFDLAEKPNALEWSQRTEGTGGASGTRGRDGSLGPFPYGSFIRYSVPVLTGEFRRPLFPH